MANAGCLAAWRSAGGAARPRALNSSVRKFQFLRRALYFGCKHPEHVSPPRRQVGPAAGVLRRLQGLLDSVSYRDYFHCAVAASPALQDPPAWPPPSAPPLALSTRPTTVLFFVCREELVETHLLHGRGDLSKQFHGGAAAAA